MCNNACTAGQICDQGLCKASPSLIQFVGGAGSDSIRAVVADASQSLHIAGLFEQSITLGSQTFTAVGTSDGYLVKLNDQGVALWGKHLSGLGVKTIEQMRLDSTGNLYVMGTFTQTLEVDTFSITATGTLKHSFLLKLDSSGVVQWLQAISGAGDVLEPRLAIAPDDSLRIGGSFAETAVVGSSTFTAAPSSQGIYLARLSSAGVLTWGLEMVGTGQKRLDAIETDPAGNLIIAGAATGSPMLGPLLATITASTPELFLGRISATGSPQWFQHFIGGGTLSRTHLSLDQLGVIFWAGTFTADLEVSTAPNITLDHTGTHPNLFISRFTPNGAAVFAKKLHNTNPITLISLANNGADLFLNARFTGTLDLGNTTASAGTGGVLFAQMDTLGRFLRHRSTVIPSDTLLLGGGRSPNNQILLFGAYSSAFTLDSFSLPAVTPSGTAEGFLWVTHF